MRKLILLTSILLLNTQCKNENTSEFNRKKLLENIAYGIVIPQINEAIKTAQILAENIEQLEEDLCVEKLNISRDSWKELLFQWKAIEILNIGTIKSSFIHSSIGRWPCNPLFIDNLCTTDNLNIQDIYSSGASSKGIYAIEYLLFDNNIITNSDKLKLLKIQTEALGDAFDKLLDLWIGPNAYSETFTTDLDMNIYSPFASYINAIVSNIDFIYKERLGKPMGKFNITQIIAPYTVENKYARISLKAINKSLTALLKLYKGNEQLGIDDNLISVLGNSDLSNKIEEQFNICINQSSKLSESLIVALENNYEELEILYDEIRKLKIILKNEMSSTLSVIIILGTSDGD